MDMHQRKAVPRHMEGKGEDGDRIGSCRFGSRLDGIPDRSPPEGVKKEVVRGPSQPTLNSFHILTV